MSSVRLRPLTIADAEVIAGWAADPDFRAVADWPDRTPEQYLTFHRGLITSPPPDLLRLGVIHNGDLVGYVDLHGDDPHWRELGFVIGERSRWGAGLGRAAAEAATAHGFDSLNLHEIRAEAATGNHRSLRILHSLGMTRQPHSGPRQRFVLRAG
ncbi:GNAT family N-acetyltransferase [Actinoplanes couchii]|uniref:N-acetyltransferase domain-containing protein n=1 Tax=Actinoplanes couchii TaxID=403638 RepID=A0ABQ3XR94_9ACTN|nr:GNAT family N-acetyltransferase [Actinoplanes couchii]MDR6319997.1 RimJ/RimL family protein N-acetyltransferase [Actinoplanes couchii]GID61037.1 hypothetical protein Aco03nite_094410 [Actinoplanes couchii]